MWHYTSSLHLLWLASQWSEACDKIVSCFTLGYLVSNEMVVSPKGGFRRPPSAQVQRRVSLGETEGNVWTPGTSDSTTTERGKGETETLEPQIVPSQAAAEKGQPLSVELGALLRSGQAPSAAAFGKLRKGSHGAVPRMCPAWSLEDATDLITCL